jgi:hypothetical protein
MPAPKNSNTSAATARSVAVRVRGKHDKWAVEMRAAGWNCEPPEQASDKRRFDAAVDYVINRLDLDQQEAFWALADGVVTEDELGELTAAEIAERRAETKG